MNEQSSSEDTHIYASDARILSIIPSPPELRLRHREGGHQYVEAVVCLALVELPNGVRYVAPIGAGGFPVVSDYAREDDGLTMEFGRPGPAAVAEGA